MAKLPVEIIDLHEARSVALGRAVEEANKVQNEIDFTYLGADFVEAMRLNVFTNIHTGTFFDTLVSRKREWRGFHPFIICFVDRFLYSDRLSNLFGSRRSEAGVGLVTTYGVEDLIIPKGKMAAYFIYELASHALAFIVSGREHHAESRGCIFDLKAADKRAILSSMRAGAPCDECRKWFLANGKDLSSQQLVAINALLHKSSLLIEEGADLELDAEPKSSKSVSKFQEDEAIPKGYRAGNDLEAAANRGAVREDPSVEPSKARKVWREKLDFLLVERASAADAAVKFRLDREIEEAREVLKGIRDEQS